MSDRDVCASERRLARIVSTALICLLFAVGTACPASGAVETTDPAQVYDRMRSIEAKLTALGREVEQAMEDLGRKEEEVIDNANKLNAAKVEMAHLRETFDRRVVHIYRYGDVEPIKFLLNVSNFSELLTTTQLLLKIAEHDAHLVKRITRLESDIKIRQARLQVATIEQRKLVDGLEQTKAKLIVALNEQRDILTSLPPEVLAAASAETTATGGFVFPVAAPYTYVDSWGAPRMTGSRYEHTHEGTDIMALPWSHALAIEDGVISKMGKNTLGGISLWLKGDSGNKYYYAHLYGYADGLAVGQRVKAGQHIGFIGDTGNARGTPHLHLQVHPQGKEPVNPYPLLTSIDPLRRPVSNY